MKDGQDRKHILRSFDLKLFLNGSCYHLMLFGTICVIFCAIWYHLYNFKNAKNTHGGVVLLV